MNVQDTSLEVYHNEIKDNVGKKQLRVLKCLSKAKRPVCNQEIADHLEQPINTITPRMNELVKKNLAEEAFRDIYPKTGRRVIYWRITEEGKRYI